MSRQVFFSKKGVAGAGVTLAGLGGLLNWFGGGESNVNKFDKDDLSDLTVVVTGAASPIGFQAAEELAKKKARIILVADNLEKCDNEKLRIMQNSRNDNIFCRKCDMNSVKSIHALASKLASEERSIDILVNHTAVDLKKSDGFDAQASLNSGLFLLTMLLFDKIKESAPGRVVNIIDIEKK